MSGRRVAALGALSVVTLLGAWVLGSTRSSDAPTLEAPAHPVAARSDGESYGPVRWIVAGGGPTPELNQVQIEQDVTHAVEVLGARGPGRVLFGGGRNGRSVQVLDSRERAPTLRARLGELLDPRPGREARYRPSEVDASGPASRESILAAIEGALGEDDGPLTVFFTGHGTGGEAPHESQLETWGAGSLWVDDLAELLDGAADHRPVRLVVSSCFAGGFGELAFRAADPEEGPAETARCGLFATTWDRVASGCDPDPDRGAQDGYAIHFLHALAKEDRDGAPDASVDLDADGAVSLLEAHTRARIASRSLDLPITTSEVFLRAAIEDDPTAEEAPFAFREEDALVAALSDDLDLADEPATLRARREQQEALERLGARLDEIDDAWLAAREDLAASLLHRWPALSDPWREDFDAALDADGAAITAFLEASALAARERELAEARAAIAETHDAALVELAPIERLARAHETLRLARQLRAEGGAYWLRYLAFLDCERGLP